MKKTLVIMTLLGCSIAAQAQSHFEQVFNQDFVKELSHIIAVLTVIYLIASFIINLVKLFLDNRLKKAIIEKGAPESVITQLLPGRTTDKKAAVKWFVLLTSIAIGLTIITFSLPVGIHSVIIMTFSIALGFLGYYFLLKKVDN